MAPPASSADSEIPLDDEAKRLKLEQVKAEARKAIAEAQKAALASQLPSPEFKSPEGTVDLSDKAGLVAQLVAYEMLNAAAKTIANEVVEVAQKGHPGSKLNLLLVDDRRLVATDWPYQIIHSQLTHESSV